MEYYIAISGSAVEWKKVDGRPIKNKTPFDLFFHYGNPNRLVVSEATTGRYITGYYSGTGNEKKDNKGIILAAIATVMANPLLTAENIGNYQAQGWISPLYKR